jgi:hypothetical protein
VRNSAEIAGVLFRMLAEYGAQFAYWYLPYWWCSDATKLKYNIFMQSVIWGHIVI